MFPELENSVLELESLDVKEEINFKRELEEYESKVSDQVVQTHFDKILLLCTYISVDSHIIFLAQTADVVVVLITVFFFM